MQTRDAFLDKFIVKVWEKEPLWRVNEETGERNATFEVRV